MTQLNIIFENLTKFFFEGEKIRVKLEVNLDKALTVNKIRANFVGLSSYLTSDGKQNKVISKSSAKNNTEVYFDDAFPLFVASNNETEAWPRGIQTFTFDFQLPNSLPSSVESPNCFVRYSVHVLAEVNEELLKKTEYFTVVSKTDLNKNVLSHIPGVVWKPENQCFLQDLFCKTGPIRAFFHIAKRGYVPGDTMLISAEICNFNRFPIEWVKTILVQELKPRSGKSFVEKRIVTEITRGCILPSETQTWRCESMMIPAIPPTTCPSKKHINIKYKVIYQIKPSWQRKPIELTQKIIIGVVGVMECEQEEQGQGQGERVYCSKYFNGSNLEPCVFGPHFIEEDGKCSIFTPLYPTYVAM